MYNQEFIVRCQALDRLPVPDEQFFVGNRVSPIHAHITTGIARSMFSRPTANGENATFHACRDIDAPDPFIQVLRNREESMFNHYWFKERSA